MSEKMKLVPIEPTAEMIAEAISEYVGDIDAVETYKAMIAAAPSQEVEPVDCKWVDEHGETCWGPINGLQPKDATPLYLSPLTAEQAAADMKRRCIATLERYIEQRPTTERGLIIAKECLEYIKALPTSDTAMEEMRRDAERYRWLREQSTSAVGIRCSEWYQPNGQWEDIEMTALDEAIDAAIAAENSQTEPKGTGSEI
jgi:hypothetical protein